MRIASKQLSIAPVYVQIFMKCKMRFHFNNVLDGEWEQKYWLSYVEFIF